MQGDAGECKTGMFDKKLQRRLLQYDVVKGKRSSASENVFVKKYVDD